MSSLEHVPSKLLMFGVNVTQGDAGDSSKNSPWFCNSYFRILKDFLLCFSKGGGERPLLIEISYDVHR